MTKKKQLKLINSEMAMLEKEFKEWKILTGFKEKDYFLFWKEQTLKLVYDKHANVQLNKGEYSV